LQNEPIKIKKDDRYNNLLFIILLFNVNPENNIEKETNDAQNKFLINGIFFNTGV
jgi:hypothetical protein